MKTYSVCPECNRQLPAQVVKRDDGYWLRKECPEHGRFAAPVWRGETLPGYIENSAQELRSSSNGITTANIANNSKLKTQNSKLSQSPPPCPTACGLCEQHLQSTCCVLVELTKRCNLRCPVCFANAGDSVPAATDVTAPVHFPERTPSQWYDVFKRLVDENRTFVQLSGGEPTVLDDLPDIVAAAVRAGCENIQLNSNGIRLGQDTDFTKRLANAGLSFVFMQFDGVTDDVYIKLRGRPLLAEKLAAIEACDRANLGVTLVPTIVPKVNVHQIRDILKFGFEHSPAVRGVHFQPISYFGRYPKNAPTAKDRITLPEISAAIELQTNRLVKTADLGYSTCDHPRCGFHGDFVVLPDRLLALKPSQVNANADADSDDCCCTPGSTLKNGQISVAALKNREFVSRRWKRVASVNVSGDASTATIATSSNIHEPLSFDGFLQRVKSHGFTVTAMAFQDRWTLDTERLRRCSLHVCEPDSGNIVPFCAYYSRVG
jgi:uncharacterized radical SAM superfamily Fe-S cluster-containing enzyme